MRHRYLLILALPVVVTFSLAFIEPQLSLQAAPRRQNRSHIAAQPTVGSTFKNIQVLTDLKDEPVSQLYSAMQFMAGSLSVSCNYCHVSQHGPFDSDAKKTKQIAREMIKMTRAINTESFEGRQVVTCNTCHQGSPHPKAVPSPWDKSPEEIAEYNEFIAGAAPEGISRQSTADKAGASPALPTIDQLLARYRQAVGANGLKSLRLTGTSTVAVSGNATPVPFEVDFAFPDRLLLSRGSPGSEAQDIVNQDRGWRRTAQSSRSLPPTQIASIRHSSEEFLPVKYATSVSSGKVSGTAKIDEKRYYVVQLQSPAGLERLFFDEQSGLLYKYHAEVATPLGTRVEEQTFEDYRTVSGVVLAFRITNHYMEEQSIFEIHDAKINVMFDPTRFEPSGNQ